MNIRDGQLAIRHRQPRQTLKLQSHVEGGNPGNEFLDWLRSELASGAINVHRATAPVKVVVEGVLLVTPAITEPALRAALRALPWPRRALNYLPIAAGANLISSLNSATLFLDRQLATGPCTFNETLREDAIAVDHYDAIAAQRRVSQLD